MHADTDRVVEKALEWLAARQNSDGSWTDAGDDRTGVAILAFTGAGYAHNSRVYGAIVRNGLQWILSRQREDGRIAERDFAAAYALLDDYILTASYIVADPARRAVAFASQDWDPGRWGMHLKRAGRFSDLSLSWKTNVNEPEIARLIQNLPKRDKPDYPYWLDTSSILFLAEGPKGKNWLHWEYELKKALLPLQSSDGSWASSIHDTAINAMTLEVYYRHFWKN